MQEHYNQIRFIAANYSRLQGLREVPVGILLFSVCLWATFNQGPTADLTLPILLTALAAISYWLIGRYYQRTFGQVKKTFKMRIRDVGTSVLFAVLALLAFWLDTAQELPVITLGLVFALALFGEFWQATSSVRDKAFTLYPENAITAALITILSLLPFFGVSWWKWIGLVSPVVSALMVIGILTVIAGMWGHLRLIRALPISEAKSNDNTL